MLGNVVSDRKPILASILFYGRAGNDNFFLVNSYLSLLYNLHFLLPQPLSKTGPDTTGRQAFLASKF